MKIAYQKSRLSGSIFADLMVENAGSWEKSDDGYAIPIIWRTNGEFFIIGENAGSEEKSDDGYAIPIIWRTNGEFFITLGSF